MPRPDPYRLIDTDSTPIEIGTGLFIGLLCVLCWVGDWFSGFLVHLHALAGSEIYIALVGTSYGAWTVWRATTPEYSVRRGIAAVNAAALMLLGTLIVREHGVSVPGGPALILAALMQAWSILSLTIKKARVDAW